MCTYSYLEIEKLFWNKLHKVNVLFDICINNVMIYVMMYNRYIEWFELL